MTQTFDPTRHASDQLGTDGVQGPLAAIITESYDAAGGIYTAYSKHVGDTFNGVLSSGSDEDWIQITLTQGQAYRISMTGDTLSDPFLGLFDSTGNLVTYNDDISFPSNLNSEIVFTAGTNGTYYIAADAHSTETGSYSVTVSQDTPPPSPEPATYDELADFLIKGTRGYEISFSPSQASAITVDISGLTALGQQMARWATDAWEMVANIDFVIQSDGVQGNEMITADDEEPGAFAFFPNSGATDTSLGDNSDGVELNIERDWFDTQGTTLDSNSFQTFVHEFGHALGLAHMGDYNFNGQAISYSDDATFANDSWQLSVMSYFSQTDNPTTNASFGYAAGPMMIDIHAIQKLYGAPGANGVTAGDTVFGQNSNIGNYLDDLFTALASGNPTANTSGNPVAFTIYDQGGIDTLDLSFLDNLTPGNINLQGGSFSDLGNNIAQIGIAIGTVIENLTTGAGDDTVTGNSAGNMILLGFGNDSIDAAGGDDSLEGGIGFDTIHGGDNADTILGGDGADSLFGDDGDDRIEGEDGFDQLYGGKGDDTLISGQTADRVYGGEGNDLIRGGTNLGLTVDGLYGDAGNDTIFGDGGFDLIDGGAGDDSLDGGAQADNIYGRDGFDTLLGGNGLDRLFGGGGDDSLSGGEGNDGHFGEAGNDTMEGGTGTDLFYGGSGNDRINGGADNDTIYGNAGFDTIDSGTGDDMLFGRFNADTFAFADGHGNDTIGDFNALNTFERIDLNAVTTISGLADLDLGSASSGAATQVGANVEIDTGGGSVVILNNVSIGDLDANDFIF